MNNAELIEALRYCPSHGCGRCVAVDENGVCTLHGVVGIMNSAADVIETDEKFMAQFIENIEHWKKQVIRLRAQLPKEGEWIEVHDWLQIPQEERGTYRCSACGQVMKYPWNYCPNCGARMKGESNGES